MYVNIYTMLMLCYHSRASAPTLDRLFNLACSVGGWASISLYAISLDIWLPEEYATMAILIDSDILRRPKEDYIL
jgi:hypothetical protein